MAPQIFHPWPQIADLTLPLPVQRFTYTGKHQTQFANENGRDFTFAGANFFAKIRLGFFPSIVR